MMTGGTPILGNHHIVLIWYDPKVLTSIAISGTDFLEVPEVPTLHKAYSSGLGISKSGLS